MEREKTLADYDRDIALLDEQLAKGNLNEHDRDIAIRARQEAEYQRCKFTAGGRERRGKTVIQRMD